MYKIERKYLLNSSIETLINDLQLTKQNILEFFVVMRVCKKIKYCSVDSRYYKIIQTGAIGSRNKKIIEISKKQYYKKEKNRIGNFISKNRYLLQESGEKYFIDKYNNYLEDIYILEIDFKKRKDAQNFVLPDIFKNFMIKEITHDKLYLNSNLALFNNPENNSYNIFTIFKDIELGRIVNIKNVIFEEMKTSDAVRIMLYKLFIDLKISHDLILHEGLDKGLQDFKYALKNNRIILSEYSNIFDKSIVQKVIAHLKLFNLALKKEKDLQFIKNELKKMDTLIDSDKMKIIQRNIDKSIFLERANIEHFFTTRKVSIIFKQYELLLKESSNRLFSQDAQIPISDSIKYRIFMNYKKIILLCERLEGCQDDKKIKKPLVKLKILLKNFDMAMENNKNKTMKKSLKSILIKFNNLKKLKKKSLIAKTYLENIETKDHNKDDILKIVEKESNVAILKKSQILRDAMLDFKKQKTLYKP